MCAFGLVGVIGVGVGLCDVDVRGVDTVGSCVIGVVVVVDVDYGVYGVG